MTNNLRRVRNWSRELETWAERHRRKSKWAWGETDCGTLTREALRVMFGRSIIEADYHSRTGAHRFMRELSCDVGDYLETFGARALPLNEVHGLWTFDGLIGGDIVVRMCYDGPLPALAISIDGKNLLTSDPQRGPHWIGTRDLLYGAQPYRF